MRERTISSVTPIADTDWGEEPCMDTDPEMASTCKQVADFVVELEYEDEPDKTFYSMLCDTCTAEYTKKHDAVSIFGE